MPYLGIHRVRLAEVRQIVRNCAPKMRQCRNCGGDVDASMQPCCVAKRQRLGNTRRKIKS
jgi:hypothetical protein